MLPFSQASSLDILRVCLSATGSNILLSREEYLLPWEGRYPRGRKGAWARLLQKSMMIKHRKLAGGSKRAEEVFWGCTESQLCSCAPARTFKIITELCFPTSGGSFSCMLPANHFSLRFLGENYLSLPCLSLTDSDKSHTVLYKPPQYYSPAKSRCSWGCTRRRLVPQPGRMRSRRGERVLPVIFLGSL